MSDKKLEHSLNVVLSEIERVLPPNLRDAFESILLRLCRDVDEASKVAKQYRQHLKDIVDAPNKTDDSGKPLDTMICIMNMVKSAKKALELEKDED